MCTHTCMRACMHAYLPTYLLTYYSRCRHVYACMHACLHTHIRVLYVRTYIRTYIHVRLRAYLRYSHIVTPSAGYVSFITGGHACGSSQPGSESRRHGRRWAGSWRVACVRRVSTVHVHVPSWELRTCDSRHSPESLSRAAAPIYLVLVCSVYISRRRKYFALAPPSRKNTRRLLVM